MTAPAPTSTPDSSTGAPSRSSSVAHAERGVLADAAVVADHRRAVDDDAGLVIDRHAATDLHGVGQLDAVLVADEPEERAVDDAERAPATLWSRRPCASCRAGAPTSARNPGADQSRPFGRVVLPNQVREGDALRVAVVPDVSDHRDPRCTCRGRVSVPLRQFRPATGPSLIGSDRPPRENLREPWNSPSSSRPSAGGSG